VNVTDAVAEAPHQIVADLQRRLDEALAQQAATADVLKIISRSSFDLQSVLETVITSAVRLCGANRGSIFLREGEVFPLRAASGTTPGFLQFWAANPCKAGRGSATARVIASGKIEVIADVLADPEMEMPPDSLKNIRAALGVPMLRDDRVEGVMVLTRPEPGPFSQSQIDLVQTFADQAVIAIENARLFDEVQAKTRDLSESLQQQTATADVLKVIASSTGDLQSVFDQVLEKATGVCGAEFGLMGLFDGDIYRRVASYNVSQAFEASAPRERRPDPDSPTGIVGRTGRVVRVDDLSQSELYLARRPAVVVLVEAAGARTLVVVPMLRDARPIGAISIYRKEVRPFSDRQVELLKNFASQAVIAIENTRLLNELRDRTEELSRSLDDLRTAQDRLVQTEKLASLGQLTAGIAHEIKNPLNFVNNFSSLSAELVGELDETLAPAPLDQKMRGDVGELTAMLKANLEKVVQHGKRADSIVKNMLLHSREGSGEHRSADINALVEDSLNLAYHGARAERPGFNITLARNLDPNAGAVELYPQEITRALLNLISNGFYAATKRKSEARDDSFEPTLSATTKNLGNKVEIRIRDNGTGIPDEVKEKMFNPFFTTKPTGEGTGLGLSMAHDIIVKQHGGRIDVQTEPGSFTEFIITLPRVNGGTSSRQPE
jgi:signal transduction histidine kinase